MRLLLKKSKITIETSMRIKPILMFLDRLEIKIYNTHIDWTFVTLPFQTEKLRKAVESWEKSDFTKQNEEKKELFIKNNNVVLLLKA